MDRYKYPKIWHCPNSPGISERDKVHPNMDHFEDMYVVVTEKMDGENTSMYPDFIHARSAENLANHESRDWIKGFHGRIKHLIPTGWRICGENMYGKHSIFYENLESYFYGFTVWDEHNVCLDWQDTLDAFKELGIVPVKVLYEGKYDPTELYRIQETLDLETQEGYVVRNVEDFFWSHYHKNAAKWVRKGHVQTGTHWMHEKVIPNKLMK